MSVLKSFEKIFSLLGHRRYVQGSTLTYGLLEAIENWKLGKIERLRANFHSLLSEHGRYDLYLVDDRPLSTGKGYNALFQLSCEAGIYIVGLKGNGNPVSTMQPYDEDSLIEGYHVSETKKSAVLEVHPNSPLLNILIALNKKLVGRLFPTEGYGQWFLSRYDLAWAVAHMRKSEFLEIKIAGNIGLCHTHSTIKVGGVAIGSIYFSRNPV